MSGLTPPAAGGQVGFSATLRRARLNARLTQAQLAYRSGLSTRTISDLERGRIERPRNASLDLLVTALEADEELSAALIREAGPPDGALAAAPGQPPSSAAAESSPLPLACELPAAVPDFTGREREQALLAASVAGRAAADGAPAVALLTGAPGVGKTALAVRFGHALAARSAVTQLFVELGGATSPLAPAEGLRQMLSSLGVADSRCPADLAGRTRMYRSLLYRRRTLILLDDAADEAQVRALLPAGAECVVVITSRRTLAGLSPTIRLPLDVLPSGPAAALLAAAAGPRWPGSDEAAARELVLLCGRLPLAVRIAGNQLAARPGWPAARLAARLRDERTRLELLTAGDLAVRPTFDTAYQQLSARAQLVFGLLALLPAGGFTAGIVDRLTGPGESAWPAVDELADAGMIQAAAADRYRMNDLLRLYARGKQAEAGAPARIAAARRRIGCRPAAMMSAEAD